MYNCWHLWEYISVPQGPVKTRPYGEKGGAEDISCRKNVTGLSLGERPPRCELWNETGSSVRFIDFFVCLSYNDPVIYKLEVPL